MKPAALTTLGLAAVSCYVGGTSLREPVAGGWVASPTGALAVRTTIELKIDGPAKYGLTLWKEPCLAIEVASRGAAGSGVARATTFGAPCGDHESSDHALTEEAKQIVRGTSVRWSDDGLAVAVHESALASHPGLVPSEWFGARVNPATAPVPLSAFVDAGSGAEPDWDRIMRAVRLEAAVEVDDALLARIEGAALRCGATRAIAVPVPCGNGDDRIAVAVQLPSDVDEICVDGCSIEALGGKLATLLVRADLPDTPTRRDRYELARDALQPRTCR